VLLESDSFGALYREIYPSEIPEIPVRERLRPCCAFGRDLQVRVGAVPVPGYEIGNVRAVEDLGDHTYDSGALARERSGEGAGLIRDENNGLVYTCRGGFIDTAHVRDWVDWSLFLAAAIGRSLETGSSIELPSEGAVRRVVVKPVDLDRIQRYGRTRIAARLGQWAAFQLSIWHEIATWYGWSSVETFPETASAFSPEDLYSNMLGVRMAGAIIIRHSGRTEHIYNDNVDAWLRALLEELGAVPREVGIEAIDAVDGLWWDSDRRLPDTELVLRRNMDVAGPIQPWLVPDSRIDSSLRAGLDAACSEDRQPRPLASPASEEGENFSDWVRVEFDLEEELATQEPFTRLGSRVSQADFPAIIEVIREQNRALFGADADRPE
jgi:hypothetical protein